MARILTATRTAMAQAIITAIGNGGKAKLYDGTMPTNLGSPGGSLLATGVFTGVPIGTATSGAIDIDGPGSTRPTPRTSTGHLRSVASRPAGMSRISISPSAPAPTSGTSPAPWRTGRMSRSLVCRSRCRTPRRRVLPWPRPSLTPTARRLACRCMAGDTLRAVSLAVP